ncbi:hypothetical protein ACIO7M_13595 [Streptomyces toxytricini]|uniref:DUF3618 domain-containing protein n=1 Tax=Streptomyces toxytricini TaxID=67369 RepID=A0ABW8EFX4_STRT5
MSDFDDRGTAGRSGPQAMAHTVKEKAGEGAAVVGEKTSRIAGTVGEQAAGVAGEAGARARDLAGELRTQVRDQARGQTGRLAQNVRSLADDLARMAEADTSGSPAASAVRRVADGGRRMASRMESRGPDGLLSDLQDFARRRPGAFLAGAALAGFALGRIGKGTQAAGSSGGPSVADRTAPAITERAAPPAGGGPPDAGQRPAPAPAVRYPGEGS